MTFQLEWRSALSIALLSRRVTLGLREVEERQAANLGRVSLLRAIRSEAQTYAHTHARTDV